MPESEKQDSDSNQKIVVNHVARAENPQSDQTDSSEDAESTIQQTAKISSDESSPNSSDRRIIEPDKTTDEVDVKEPDQDEGQSKGIKTAEEIDDKPDDNSQKSVTHEGSDNIVNELAEAAASKKQEKTNNDHEQAYIQSLEKLVEEKTYNVPIGQLTHKRNTRIIVAVFIVIALLAAVTIMFLT